MPGRIVLVSVAGGDSVAQGQELLVMEAMKMELSLKAPRDGVVAQVRTAEGEFVDADASLVTLERSQEHTSELQSLMRISYAVFCLTKKNRKRDTHTRTS